MHFMCMYVYRVECIYVSVHVMCYVNFIEYILFVGIFVCYVYM